MGKNGAQIFLSNGIALNYHFKISGSKGEGVQMQYIVVYFRVPTFLPKYNNCVPTYLPPPPNTTTVYLPTSPQIQQLCTYLPTSPNATTVYLPTSPNATTVYLPTYLPKCNNCVPTYLCPPPNATTVYLPTSPNATIKIVNFKINILVPSKSSVKTTVDINSGEAWSVCVCVCVCVLY